MSQLDGAPNMTPVGQAIVDFIDTQRLAGALRPYENDEQALFAVMCESAYLYVHHWVATHLASAASGNALGAAAIILDVDDTDDPSRVADPIAVHRTLLELMFDSMFDNVIHHLEHPDAPMYFKED